jgi:hypothetical protein
VLVELPPALPNPVERAEARGLVALREPLAIGAVREVVFRFLSAWQHESLEEMVALLADDAGPIDSRPRGRTALVEAWRQRLHTHEYRRLATLDIVRNERIEHYDWDDLCAPGAPARPRDMRPDELYVRVPIEVTRVAGERVFGDVLLLVLSREQGRYAIAAVGEADAP